VSGNVTFHGPGQLVAYPILDLHGHKRNVRWYVSSLEEALIETAATFGLQARAGDDGETGVWVEDRKLAAIGVSVKRWVTSHGIALNSNVDLNYFNMIVPCGLHAHPRVTSLSKELTRDVDVSEAAPVFISSLASTMRCDIVKASETDKHEMQRIAQLADADLHS